MYLKFKSLKVKLYLQIFFIINRIRKFNKIHIRSTIGGCQIRCQPNTTVQWIINTLHRREFLKKNVIMEKQRVLRKKLVITYILLKYQ